MKTNRFSGWFNISGCLDLLILSHILSCKGGILNYLYLRNGHYYLNRRVPEMLREYDLRVNIRISLKTDSRLVAQKRALALNEQIEAYWQGLVKDGQNHDGRKFNDTVKAARKFGFAYISVNEVAQLPIAELIDRILSVKTGSQVQVEAVLGGKPEVKIKLKDTLEKFWALTQNQTFNKSPHHLRKWKNPRIKAVHNFIKIVGNKELDAVTRDDVLEFQKWWLKRINKDGKNPGSANKDFVNLKNILSLVSKELKIGLDIRHLFEKIMLTNRFTQAKQPFTRQQIVDILESDKLGNLNEDARWLLFAAAETGARPSELAGLLPEDIKLNAAIPHISITDRIDRPLKTVHSQRDIPLVGYALIGFQNSPRGFSRYRKNPDHLTTTVNKFLRENKLMPSPKHTMYSLRHSFQDRILSVNAPDRVQAELMGHKFNRPMYGDGASLEQKLEWMEKIRLLT